MRNDEKLMENHVNWPKMTTNWLKIAKNCQNLTKSVSNWRKSVSNWWTIVDKCQNLSVFASKTCNSTDIDSDRESQS